jgi:hypothetical protein
MYTIDIDVDDFLESCGKYDIEQIIEYLVDMGWINKPQPEPDISLADVDWHNAITKLQDRGRMQLTREEEDLILSIANRIV